MPNVFLISDTHFGHANILTFKNKVTDERIRPLWEKVEEMDEDIISRWNSVVGVNDKVYHLGDVAINRKHLWKMDRLNGKKVLIKGNHDIFTLEEYTKYFYDVRAYHVLSRMMLSHIPIHPRELDRFKVNVHGHLHENIVLDNTMRPDPRYISVCVEQINYTPVELSTLIERADKL